MPWAPKKPCRWPGCGRLVDGGYCDAHKPAVEAKAQAKQAAYDAERQATPSRAWYKDKRWFALRSRQLRDHPLCQCDDCREGSLRVREAKVVDHIKAHRGDERLFFDPTNLRSMATDCHNRKTAREDGGFGNPRRRG